MILLFTFTAGIVCAEDNATSDSTLSENKTNDISEEISIKDAGILSESEATQSIEDENNSEDLKELNIVIYSNDIIYPWSWADSDGDSGPGIDIWTFNYFPKYNPTGNTTIYFNGEIVDVIPGGNDYLISTDYIWDKYSEEGIYTVNAVYSGDEHFKPANITEKFYITNHMCEIKNDLVFVTLPSATSGNLTVKVNGKTYTKKIKATYNSGPHPYEIYNIQLKDLKTGTKYNVEVDFKGDSDKYSFTESIMLNYQINLLIDIFLKDKYGYYYSYEYEDGHYNYGEDNSIIFSVPKDLKNKVSFTIDGKSYNYTEISGDISNYGDPLNEMAFKVDIHELMPGNHTIDISYPGDSKYPSFSLSQPLKVLTEIISGENKTLSLHLPSDAKGNLTVEIRDYDESNYTLFDTVTVNGQKGIIQLPRGEYYMKAYYSGSDYEIEGRDNSEYVYSCPIVVNYGESKILRIPNQINSTLVLYLGSDKESRLAIAEYSLNQKSVFINKTFIDEILNISMAKLLIEQNYKEYGFYFFDLTSVISSSSGNFELQPVRITFSNKITGLTDITMQYSDSKTITLKVYDIYGKTVGENQVIKIQIGKKSFTAKTYANGVVKFKIPNTIIPGKYNVKITYKTAKVSKKLTVKQILSIKTATVKKSAKKLVLTATLKKGKTPIKNKKVTFKFNGKTYKAKTNSKGIAKVTIKSQVLKKLKVGKKVTYQATYLKDTVKKTVKVLK